MKTEPTAELRTLASVLWQMHVALIDEGFTEMQALTILGHVVAANSGQGNNS